MLDDIFKIYSQLVEEHKNYCIFKFLNFACGSCSVNPCPPSGSRYK